MFKDFPFIDYDEFTYVSFDVVKFISDDEDDVYNVHINFTKTDEDDVGTAGLIYRTGIYATSIKECSTYINALLSMNFFGSEIHIAANGIVFTEDAEIESQFDWNDYNTEGSSEERVLH